jgi:hypothetical protein
MVALKKKTSITLPVLLCVMLALAALNPPGKAQAPGAARKMMQPGGPKVLDDGRVTFTLNAPEADKLALNIHPGYRRACLGCLAQKPTRFCAASLPVIAKT